MISISLCKSSQILVCMELPVQFAKKIESQSLSPEILNRGWVAGMAVKSKYHPKLPDAKLTIWELGAETGQTETTYI